MLTIKSKKLVFFPGLSAIYPILYLYSHNLGLVKDDEVVTALILCLVATFGLFVFINFFYRSVEKTAVVVTGIHLIFFGFSTFENFISRDLLTWLSFAAIPIGIILVSFIKSATLFEAATKILSPVLVALLVIPTFQTAKYWYRVEFEGFNRRPVVYRESLKVADKILNSPENPDIYYIIADGYPNNSFLLKTQGYDNSAFTTALEERGFFVAYNSKSSYGGTLLSISSTLNMRYIIQNETQPRVDDLIYLRTLIADNLVAQELIEKGYTYVYLLSGYLLPSQIADINWDFTPGGIVTPEDIIGGPRDTIAYKQSFLGFLAEESLLYKWAPAIQEQLQLNAEPYLWSNPQRFSATLEALEEIAKMPEATFTFAHLMEPHIPVQRDRDGNLLERSLFQPSRQEYFDEFQFTNECYLETIDMILEISNTPPIIILQGDHGTILGNLWTEDHRLIYFDVLNALHLPGKEPAVLTGDFGTINTFRMLFNTYFNTDYEMLDIRHYDFPDGYDNPFNLVDVTDEFQ